MERNQIIIDQACGLNRYDCCEEINMQFPKMKEYFSSSSRKEWAVFPLSMGCMLIAHHDATKQNEPIYVFFMHADSWGQYGDATSDIPKLANFIPPEYSCGEDCQDLEQLLNRTRQVSRQQVSRQQVSRQQVSRQQVSRQQVSRQQVSRQQVSRPNKRRRTNTEDIKEIRCPTCRTKNPINITELDEQSVVFQTDSEDTIPKCICCTVNNVSVMFSKCRHCVLCNDCLKKLA
jgi:hypothetical protein